MTKQEPLIERVVEEVKSSINEDKYPAVRITKETLVNKYGIEAKDVLNAVSRWKKWKDLKLEVRRFGGYIIFGLPDDIDVARWPGSTYKEKPAKEKKEKNVVYKGKTAKDKNYFKFPEETVVVKGAILARENIFLSGPTGCGKTTMLELLAQMNNVPYIRMNLNGETTVDDFVGVWTLAGKNMEFVDGVLPQAMKSGKMLILDEMDAAQPEILFTLQAVLQSAPLVNTKNGETVSPREGFFVAATANTVGRGDMDGLYAGVRTLNEAFLDRFPYVLRMKYPNKNAEIKILINRCGIKQEYANEIVQLAQAARGALTDGKLYSTFSTRKAINFANAIIKFRDIEIALRVAILDRVSKEDALAIREAAQRIWNI